MLKLGTRVKVRKQQQINRAYQGQIGKITGYDQMLNVYDVEFERLATAAFEESELIVLKTKGE
jgi:hypothetical protein